MRGWLVAIALIAGCGGAPPRAQAPTPDHGAVHVTLLHINDVYEITPIDGGKIGGLARVATVLKQLRAANPNTRMTLGGDFVSPAAVGTARVNGERLAGKQMIAVLNAAGLDLATYGNHEFDISEAQLKLRLAESRFAWLSTNVVDSLGNPLLGVPRHAILRLTDAKGRSARIAFVAATIDQVRRPNLRYRSPVTALREELALLKDSADAFVALTHLRLPEDATLADSLPELDLILGGHEHENWVIRRGNRLTPVIKADANVRSVAVVDLQLRPGARPALTWRIEPITSARPEDPGTAAEAARWTDLAYAAFEKDGLEPRKVVATLPLPLDARETIIRNGENFFTHLLTTAWLAEAPEAEVALINSGSIRLDDILPAGPITQYDVIRLLPFGGKAVVVEMTGSLLKRTLEQGDNNRGIGGFLLKANAESTPGGWRVGAAPLDTLRRYKVVTTDFLVSGGEQNMSWLSERNPSLTMLKPLRDVRLLVIDEIVRRYRK